MDVSNVKIFKLDDLSSCKKILISSTDKSINFCMICMYVTVYIDNPAKPVYEGYAEIHAFLSGQVNFTGIEIPISGKRGVVIIRHIENFDLDKITVRAKS
jgi:hypothetical protein